MIYMFFINIALIFGTWLVEQLVLEITKIFKIFQQPLHKSCSLSFGFCCQISIWNKKISIWNPKNQYPKQKVRIPNKNKKSSAKQLLNCRHNAICSVCSESDGLGLKWRSFTRNTMNNQKHSPVITSFGKRFLARSSRHKCPSPTSLASQPL